MSLESVQEELRKSNALLRATERDRDAWKGRGVTAEAENKRLQEIYRRMKTDFQILSERAEAAEQRMHAIREGLQELTETLQT